MAINNNNQTDNGDNLLNALTSTNDEQSSNSPFIAEQTNEAMLGIDAGAAVPKSGLPRGILLMAGILVIAVSALLIMRAYGNISTRTDDATTSAAKTIDIALATLVKQQKSKINKDNKNGSDISDTDKVITMFIKDPTSKQVALDDVQKNPFTITMVEKKHGDTGNLISVDRTRQEEKRRILDELGQMTLQSIMNGRTPVAVISGKIVRIGDQIGRFHVDHIEGVGVTLSTKGQTYSLSMEQKFLSSVD